MKPKLLLIAVGLTLTLFACKNKKEEIVERQKVLKHQIDSVQYEFSKGRREQMDASKDLIKQKTDSLHNDVAYKKMSKIDQIYNEGIVENSCDPFLLIKRNRLSEFDEEIALIPYKHDWDSLEVELKKY